MTTLERGLQGVREARSVTRQLRELAMTEEAPNEPVGVGPVVIFLHGIFAHGVVLNHLQDRVREQLGVPTLSFSYSRFSWSMDNLVTSFQRFLNTHTDPGSELFLVGHSLGGLIARWYAQEGDDRRIRWMATLATPHEGTQLSQLGLPWLRRLFLPEGEVIRTLKRGEQRAAHIPQICVAGELDQVIIPRESAVALEGARHFWIEGVGHNEMLYSQGLERCLLQNLTLQMERL